MDKKLSNVIKYVLSILIAALFLYFSFKGVKWADFVKGLESCRWEYIIMSMVIGIAAFWFRGMRWRELLLPIDSSTKRLTTFNAINIGYLANFVFPRIGEFVRCGFITKNSASIQGNTIVKEDGKVQTRKIASYDKVLGTVVVERAWDVIVMFIFLIAILIFGWERFGSFFVDKMWAPLSARLDFSLWWILAAIIIAIVAGIWIIIKLRNRSRLCAKITGFFTGIWQGIKSCFRMKKAWRFFLYTAIIWSMYWLMSFSSMRAVPQMDGLGITDALFLMIAGSLGWFIPVPGGFGAFHYIVALAVSVIYGVPFELGIVFATLSHESQAITMIVCGGFSYTFETMKK
jgi:uncharacterized membrane protein YbhN (UPF0104 family)